MDKLRMETPDLTSENIDKIAALFPNCITEMRDENGKLKRGINFEMLKQMLSPMWWTGTSAMSSPVWARRRRLWRPTSPSARRCAPARRKAKLGHH